MPKCSQFSGIAALSERVFAKEFAPNADNDESLRRSKSSSRPKKLSEEESKVRREGGQTPLCDLMNPTYLHLPRSSFCSRNWLNPPHHRGTIIDMYFVKASSKKEQIGSMGTLLHSTQQTALGSRMTLLNEVVH